MKVKKIEDIERVFIGGVPFFYPLDRHETIYFSVEDDLFVCPFCGSSPSFYYFGADYDGMKCNQFVLGCDNWECPTRPAAMERGMYYESKSRIGVWGHVSGKENMTDEKIVSDLIQRWSRRV